MCPGKLSALEHGTEGQYHEAEQQDPERVGREERNGGYQESDECQDGKHDGDDEG